MWGLGAIGFVNQIILPGKYFVSITAHENMSRIFYLPFIVVEFGLNPSVNRIELRFELSMKIYEMTRQFEQALQQLQQA